MSMHHHGHGDHMGLSGHGDHSAHLVPAQHASHTHGLEDACGSMVGGHHTMIFHFGYCEKVLFDFWYIHSVGTLIASFLGIFILSALYEGLKYFREYLFWRTCHNVPYRAVQIPSESNGVVDNSVVTVVGEVITKQPVTMFSRMHLFQTALHVLQLTISYLLMLIFMTFNGWLCIAVVLGAATGFFLFGWKKSVVVDVTEHCH